MATYPRISLATYTATTDIREWRLDPAQLEKILEEPHLKPIVDEFVLWKAQRCRMPTWYQLRGGPRSIEQLARKVDRPGSYELLYRNWSAVVHGQNLPAFLKFSETGEPSVRRVREPVGISAVVEIARGFAIEATLSVIDKLRPDEDITPRLKAELSRRGRLQ